MIVKENTVKKLAEEFQKMIADVKASMGRLGQEEYSDEMFQWLRPESMENLENAELLCEPYKMDELNMQGEEYVQKADPKEGIARKDYAVLSYETSLMMSINRAFNERNSPKLRHFSHSAGISDIMIQNKTGAVSLLLDYAQQLLNAK